MISTGLAGQLSVWHVESSNAVIFLDTIHVIIARPSMGHFEYGAGTSLHCQLDCSIFANCNFDLAASAH